MRSNAMAPVHNSGEQIPRQKPVPEADLSNVKGLKHFEADNFFETWQKAFELGPEAGLLEGTSDCSWLKKSNMHLRNEVFPTEESVPMRFSVARRKV